MGKFTELEEEKKIKVLKNLMEGDRVEVNYMPTEPMAPPVTECTYFISWDVSAGKIFCFRQKHGFSELKVRIGLFPLLIKNIIEIKKLIPTR